LRDALSHQDLVAALDEISGNDMDIIEACSFQDLTGQRVSKVLKSVRYVEERVNNLMEIWGREALQKVQVEGVEKSDDEKLLHGPQMEGEGISQAEIDKLFE
jgi:chemotaxis protein CheZ